VQPRGGQAQIRGNIPIPSDGTTSSHNIKDDTSINSSLYYMYLGTSLYLLDIGIRASQHNLWSCSQDVIETWNSCKIIEITEVWFSALFKGTKVVRVEPFKSAFCVWHQVLFAMFNYHFYRQFVFRGMIRQLRPPHGLYTSLASIKTFRRKFRKRWMKYLVRSLRIGAHYACFKGTSMVACRFSHRTCSSLTFSD
jgi:hypothetical protein